MQENWTTDTNWGGEGVVSSILDRIRATARVELVYGEERKIGDKTIVPIAAISYAFGGGGGGGAGTGPQHNGHSEDTAGVGGGGGGGGSVRVQPVGVLEITEDGTRLVPIIDWTRIVTTALTGAAVYLTFRAIFRRR
ncbi:MAG: spore germination protein GerW family protein [Chloroflexota bacterium]